MRSLVWIGLGWLSFTFWTAVASRVGPAHVSPDAAVVVLAFVALRRDPVTAVVVAAALGYLIGRQALAPLGLCETAAVATALGVYVVSGQLAGAGTLFFGVVAAGATVFQHVLTFALLVGFRGGAGFSSLATAALVPDALVTGVLALACHRPMDWLDHKLVTERRPGSLQWS